MAKSDVLLAHSWDGESDPTGWWLSEKLDGVRAYWDGREFKSRNGNVFHVPEFFREKLPNNLHLDGEIWGGRGNFDETSGIVRSSQRDETRWRKLIYVVFDAPSFTETFEKRMAHAFAAIDPTSRALWHPHRRCTGLDDLLAELARVQGMNGEGLMLRQPGSLYERKRSRSLLKVKTFHDADALVVGHQPGEGKHDGRMGALMCKLADGTEFKVGTGFSDEQREKPPAIGSTITFSYFELTKSGTPRFPSYVGQRADNLITATEK